MLPALSTDAGRARYITAADYREGSHLWLLMAEMTRDFDDSDPAIRKIPKNSLFRIATRADGF